MANLVKAKLRLKSMVKSQLTTRYDMNEPIVTTDTAELYVGMGDTVDAIKISDFIQVDNLPLVGIQNKMYILRSSKQGYYWDGTKYNIIAGQGGVQSFSTFASLPSPGIMNTIYIVKTDESFYPTTGTSLYVWDDFNTKYVLVSRAIPTNSYSQINVDGTPLTADNTKDTLNIVSGAGIQIDTDVDNKTITINQTGTISVTSKKVIYNLNGGIKGNLPLAIGIAASATIDDNIYIMGGYTGAAPTNVFQMYNVTTNTFTTLGTIPQIKYGMFAFPYNGNIYLGGGYNSSGAAVKDFHMYDIANNAWITKPQLNVARDSSFGALIGNKYWVLSGVSGTSNVLTGTVEYYDFTQEMWIQLDVSKNIPTPRYGGSTFVFGNLIYCCGGNTGSAYSGKVEVFDTVAQTWTTKTDMSPAIYAGASITYNGLGYIFAGRQGGTYTKTLYVYNPVADKWSLKENMTNARCYANVERYGNTFYVLGGQTSSTANTAITEVYSVASEQISNYATVAMLYPSGSTILNTVTGESAKYLGLDNGEVWHYGQWNTGTFKAIITENQS